MARRNTCRIVRKRTRLPRADRVGFGSSRRCPAIKQSCKQGAEKPDPWPLCQVCLTCSAPPCLRCAPPTEPWRSTGSAGATLLPTRGANTVLAARGVPRTSSAPRPPAAAVSPVVAALALARRMRLRLCLYRCCVAASRRRVSAPRMMSAFLARSARVSVGPRARHAACPGAAPPLRF